MYQSDIDGRYISLFLDPWDTGTLGPLPMVNCRNSISISLWLNKYFLYDLRVSFGYALILVGALIVHSLVCKPAWGYSITRHREIPGDEWCVGLWVACRNVNNVWGCEWCGVLWVRCKFTFTENQNFNWVIWF